MQENQFIPVPPTKLPNGVIVPAFRVSQYPCNKGEDGKLAAIADNDPWMVSSYDEARKACEEAGFRLLTALQHEAITVNVAQLDVNWTMHAGKRKVFFDREWLQLTNGKRIYGFGAGTWAVPSKGAYASHLELPDNSEPASFFCTR